MFIRPQSYRFFATSKFSPSPAPSYEDLTTYTPVDPESNYTIYPYSLVVTDFHVRHTVSYLYYDFGAAYFNANGVQINFDITVSSVSDLVAPNYRILALVNTLGERQSYDAGPVSHFAYKSAGKIELGCGDDLYAIAFWTCDIGTTYYCTLTRTWAGGVADGSVVLDIYSDAGRSILVASVPRLDIPAATAALTYRYLQVATSERSVSDATPIATFTISNIDIVSH